MLPIREDLEARKSNEEPVKWYWFAQSLRRAIDGVSAVSEISGWSDDSNIALHAAVNLMLTAVWDEVYYCRYNPAEGVKVMGLWMGKMDEHLLSVTPDLHHYDVMCEPLHKQIAVVLKHRWNL